MVSDKLTGWLGVKRRAARTPALGSRELAVLEILWRDGELSALQVLSRMSASSVTLSTVQSTLERLHRKDLTIRNKSGRAYYYQATLAKSDIIGNLLRDIAEDFAGGDMGPMISGFMEYIASAAPEMESDIAQALEHKKKNVLLQKTEGSLSNAAEGSLPSTAEGYLSNTAEGSLPNTAEGSLSNTAEGSLPNTAEGSLPNTAEGSLPNTAEGSLPNTAEGSLPNTAEGSIDD